MALISFAFIGPSDTLCLAAAKEEGFTDGKHSFLKPWTGFPFAVATQINQPGGV